MGRKKADEKEWERDLKNLLPRQPDEKTVRFAQSLDEINPPLIIYGRESVPDCNLYLQLTGLGNIEDEKYLAKLQQRIEDLTESLENYGFSVEDYTEEFSSWFNMVPSPNVQTIKLAYPAIVKDGQAILLGKVFIPEK